MTATLTRPSDQAAAPVEAPPEDRRVTARRYGLSDADLDALGAELDALRERIVADLGQDDVDHIRRLIRVQRGLAASGRASLFLVAVPGVGPLAWVYGAGALGLAKILDNMEIGHNIMHGQFDWTRDPALAGDGFEWDTVCDGDQWRHSHNYLHHTFTNIVGKDRDVGYGILRMSGSQRWSPWDLLNPLKATGLMLAFDHGVMLHDVEFDRIVRGERSWREQLPVLRGALAKGLKIDAKDYVLWPLLTGPLFLSTLAANATANLIRNLWAYSIIFCGHFPDGVHDFTLDECEDESRGHWYMRQILGSANIRGGALFHILSGNLSHQIEHHLFPDLPADRYHQVAGEVQEICARHGLPYNVRGLAAQLGSTWRRIWRLAMPGGS